MRAREWGDSGMRILIGAVIVAAAAMFFFVRMQPADVYAMPVAEAYQKLSAIKFEPMSEGQKVLHTERSITGGGPDTLIWSEHGDMAALECELKLAPLPKDSAKTHVTVTCKGGGAGEGAAAGISHNLQRNRVIEHVDAALTGRPFNAAKAASTASGWPGDGVDGSYTTAVATAIKMDAETRRMQREEEEARAHEAQQPLPMLPPGPQNPTPSR
jgi:hypothetical protein